MKSTLAKKQLEAALKRMDGLPADKRNDALNVLLGMLIHDSGKWLALRSGLAKRLESAVETVEKRP